MTTMTAGVAKHMTTMTAWPPGLSTKLVGFINPLPWLVLNRNRNVTRAVVGFVQYIKF